MRGFAAPLLAIPLACVLLATGCSTDAGQGDDLQLVENPVAATPAVSPVPAAVPAGTVLPAAGVSALGVDPGSRTLAVAQADPPSVQLYSLDDLAAPPRPVPLPDRVTSVQPVRGGLLATMPAAGRLARITVPDGQLSTVQVQGKPSDVAESGAQLLVATGDRKMVDVLDGDRVTKSITGQLYSADQVFTLGGSTVVLDRLRTAVFDVDLAGGAVKEGLRAGDGAANGVVDSHQRLLVTDTRAGALLAFSADPLLLRQRYPVPGGPYGVAYDPARDLAWVTLTERNELVGYEMRGGEPVERHRFPTVRQPDSVTVDPQTSRVVVGSAAGEGIQVITP